MASEVTGPDRYLAALVFQSLVRQGTTREKLISFAMGARLYSVAGYLTALRPSKDSSDEN